MNQRQPGLEEYRCPTCNKLLGKILVVKGGDVHLINETWCKNCKKLVAVTIKTPERAA